MWETIVNILSSLLGGGGGADAGAGAAAGEAAGGAAGAGAGAGLGGGIDYGGLLGAGIQGAGLGFNLANQPSQPNFGGAMPQNLMGQQNPGALRQRVQGASADLQARGVDVGAAPDFLQKQLETELGLTPDEFQRIFRLGGGATGAGGGTT